MMNCQEIRQIAGILAALPHTEPAGEDAARLDRWRAENPANEELYREIASGNFLGRKMRFVANNDVGEAYAEFLKLAGYTPEGARQSSRRRKIRRVALRWTACVAVLAGAALLVFQFGPGSGGAEADVILPGTTKAILTTADGSTYDITGSEYSDLIADRTIGGGALAPEQEGRGQEVAVHYNTVTVPRGSEFELTLNDGTTVWLNAESEIRIPMPFDRSVEVTGEAFFEVVSDPAAPFAVGLRHGTVTVTGTSFNVRDYADELFMEATLIEGRITFGADGGQSELTPGDQLRLNKASGERSVAQVDTKRYVSWKAGRFAFEQERFEDIMCTLARWYDIEVVFEDPSLKDILFTGDIRKYDDFDSVLGMLLRLNKFDIAVDGRRVVIKP